MAFASPVTDAKRLFVGIPSSQLLAEAFVRLRTTQPSKNIRWTSADNVHITLLFIGKVEERVIPEVTDALSSISSSTKSFLLQLHRYVYMPAKRSRMIWARFEESVAFTLLAAEIQNRIGHLSEDEEHKEPLPHATLARFKYLAPKDHIDLQPAPPLTLTVNSFNLYESHLFSEGSRYEVLSSFDLQP